MQKILKALQCPFAVLLFTLVISVFALAMAYTAEIAFGLEPCILCLYQRVPFALVVLLSGVGLALGKMKGREAKPQLQWIIGANALLFFANAVIAFYHTGVEQKWWKSFLEGCAVPELNGSEDLLSQIQNASTVPCDEIPWIDPLFGLSMANWNVPFCLGMMGVCVLSLRYYKLT